MMGGWGGNKVLSSLTSSLYLVCLGVLPVLLSTQASPRSIIQCSFMPPMSTDPWGLSGDTPFLSESSKYKANSTVHKGLQKKSLTEMTSNSCTSTYCCQLSLLLQVQLILAGSAWPLCPASHVPSTLLAHLRERKASTKCPFFILWSN